MPNIEGTVGTNSANNGGFAGYSWTVMNGALSFELNSAGISLSSGSYNSIKELKFDASLFNSIYGNADEVRPKTMYGIWVIKAVGVIVDSIGSTDIQSLLTGLNQLQTQLTALQNQVSDTNNFTIIYPNGGTAENPANITINSRYVEDNPFPGYYVNCQVELLIDGIWTPIFSNYTIRDNDPNNYVGVCCGLFNGNIVLRTAAYYLEISSPFSLNPNTPDRVTTAPCRVLVYKLVKIESGE